jgi:dTDP-4-amino-4,6-dideoxygalactose transaminase
MRGKVFVTKTYLPRKETYHKYLDKIYLSNWVTNFGELYEELRRRLISFLKIEDITLVANGTLALTIAYRLLGIKKAIVTPFTFVATVSSLLWDGINIVFADIDKESFCIDVDSVEYLLKKEKGIDAVVAVNVFGNACDIDGLNYLRDKYGFKLIFDSSHCFNVYFRGKNILLYGDASTISFHATKMFHTIEGGGIVFSDPKLHDRARKLSNFGFETYYVISELGINAKMNEFEAAMGLALLDEIDNILEGRKRAWEYYYVNLKDYVKLQKRNEHCTNSYSHFPVLFSSEENLLKVLSILERENIFPRRYFYPSLHKLPYIKKEYIKIELKNAEYVSERILCLPLYPGIEKEVQDIIIEVIKEVEKNA